MKTVYHEVNEDEVLVCFAAHRWVVFQYMAPSIQALQDYGGLPSLEPNGFTMSLC